MRHLLTDYITCPDRQKLAGFYLFERFFYLQYFYLHIVIQTCQGRDEILLYAESPKTNARSFPARVRTGQMGAKPTDDPGFCEA